MNIYYFIVFSIKYLHFSALSVSGRRTGETCDGGVSGKTEVFHQELSEATFLCFLVREFYLWSRQYLGREKEMSWKERTSFRAFEKRGDDHSSSPTNNFNWTIIDNEWHKLICTTSLVKHWIDSIEKFLKLMLTSYR